MSEKVTRRHIPYPFAASTVALNTDTSLLKTIAMIVMFIDHAGKMLFPQYHIMRVIGRLAFPIFAYCIAVGCVYTRDPVKYLARLASLALFVQPLYVVAMGHANSAMYAYSFLEKPLQAIWAFYINSWNKPCIVVALVLGATIICALREKHIVLAVAGLLLCYFLQDKLDYGIRGIQLMVLFYLTCGHIWLAIPVMTAYMVWWGLQGSGYTFLGINFGIQMFAVPALLPIFIRTNTGIRLPRWIGYAYYMVHLAVIYVLDKFVL